MRTGKLYSRMLAAAVAVAVVLGAMPVTARAAAVGRPTFDAKIYAEPPAVTAGDAGESGEPGPAGDGLPAEGGAAAPGDTPAPGGEVPGNAPPAGGNNNDGGTPGGETPGEGTPGAPAEGGQTAGAEVGTAAVQSAAVQSAPTERTGSPYGAYNADDIAILNAVIEANNIRWGKWTSGDTPPLHWSSVYWSADETNKRIIKLQLSILGLTTLELGGLDALESLSCYQNNLTELDLSGLPALKTLSCGENQLETLDLTGQPALTSLSCEKNPLESVRLYGGYELNLQVEPTGSGMASVRVIGWTGALGPGTTVGVILEATHNTGYMFTHWTRTGSTTEIKPNPWGGIQLSSSQGLTTTATAHFDIAPDPTISITSQPMARTEVIEGNISGSLAAAASVYPYGTPPTSGM